MFIAVLVFETMNEDLFLRFPIVRAVLRPSLIRDGRLNGGDLKPNFKQHHIDQISHEIGVNSRGGLPRLNNKFRNRIEFYRFATHQTPPSSHLPRNLCVKRDRLRDRSQFHTSIGEFRSIPTASVTDRLMPIQQLWRGFKMARGERDAQRDR